jgi:peptide/nickel transport system permease protein
MAAAAAALPARAWSQPRRFIHRLWDEKRLGALAAVALLVFLLVGLFANILAPYGFNEVNLLERLRPPSWKHPFGTDNLGRDMFSRCLYGARLSVVIGVAGAALACLISTLVGFVSGYLGGRVDLIVQRFVDAWMSFPPLVVLIAVVSVLGPGLPQTVGALGMLLGFSGSRIVRSAVIAVRAQPYVLASQAIGCSPRWILTRHVLPNVLAPVIVLFTTAVGNVILIESALAFLGLGVPPPQPTWGGMLSGSGRAYMLQGPWLALAPGLCLVAVVYAVNVFGDALRDLLDPRLRGST